MSGWWWFVQLEGEILFSVYERKLHLTFKPFCIKLFITLIGFAFCKSYWKSTSIKVIITMVMIIIIQDLGTFCAENWIINKNSLPILPEYCLPPTPILGKIMDLLNEVRFLHAISETNFMHQVFLTILHLRVAEIQFNSDLSGAK